MHYLSTKTINFLHEYFSRIRVKNEEEEAVAGRKKKKKKDNRIIVY